MLYHRVDQLVSIVIPTYNSASYIAECLDSIASQTYKNLEVIIIDDGSTDSTSEVVNKWTENNKHRFIYTDAIQYLKLPRNTGFAGAINIGFYLAKGEFIAVHDSDDISAPDRIKKQLDYLHNNPEISLVGTNYTAFKDGDFKNQKKNFWLKYDVESIKEIYAKGGHCVSHGTILFRGSLFDKIGGPTRKFKGAEDYEFIAKSISEGVDNLKDILYYYRSHSKQRSRQYYSKKNKDIKQGNLNVLMVMDGFDIGGTETHVLTLTSELIRMGISVYVIGRRGPLLDKFIESGCHVYSINFPYNRPPSITESIDLDNKVIKIIKEKKINIIHLHHPPSGVRCIKIGKLLNIPCVFTVHGMYYKNIIPNLSKCDQIITVSPPVKKLLDNSNISSLLIPNGIDLNTFSFKEFKGLRNKLNIPSDAQVIMYGSRIAWKKTEVCEIFLKACKDLKTIHKKNIHIIVVGSGRQFKKIKTLVDEIHKSTKENFIHLLGSQVDMESFYTISDYVVGTGRVALEAMSSSKPVIAAGNHGYFGLITPDTFEKAWHLHFGDHDSLKSNQRAVMVNDLNKLLESKSELKSLGKQSRKWVESRFNIEDIAKQVVDVYMSLLDKK